MSLQEQIKDIQGTFLPIIEGEKIRMAFYIGQLCWNYMRDLLKEDETVNTTELIEACQEETGLSQNLIKNASLLFNWFLNNEFIHDGGICMDYLYSWWDEKQKGNVTLAKIYRVILPKVEKEKKNAKIEGIKKDLNKYINDADYVTIKLTREGNLLLDVEGGL